MRMGVKLKYGRFYGATSVNFEWDCQQLCYCGAALAILGNIWGGHGSSIRDTVAELRSTSAAIEQRLLSIVWC